LLPPTPERIVLTGFMGSGKSTVGRLLAARLGWSFEDLDTLIEARAGKTVPAIFADEGEASFREQETAALQAVLAGSRLVLALGGGAVETETNHALLAAPGTCVVLLEAPLAVLLERCRRQAADPSATARPNLATTAGAEARFTRRAPLYRALAHEVIPSENLDAEATVAELLARLRLAGLSPR